MKKEKLNSNAKAGILSFSLVSQHSLNEKKNVKIHKNLLD